jgi:hypothetical protein
LAIMAWGLRLAGTQAYHTHDVSVSGAWLHIYLLSSTMSTILSSDASLPWLLECIQGTWVTWRCHRMICVCSCRLTQLCLLCEMSFICSNSRSNSSAPVRQPLGCTMVELAHCAVDVLAESVSSTLDVL